MRYRRNVLPALAARTDTGAKWNFATTALVVGAVSIGAYYVVRAFQKPPASSDPVAHLSKVGVKYYVKASRDPKIVERGEIVTAEITVKNTGSKDVNLTYRIDLDPTTWTKTPIEGLVTSFGTVRPGEEKTGIIEARPLPSDWQDGWKVSAKIILIGHEGVWDESIFTVREVTAVEDLQVGYVRVSQ